MTVWILGAGGMLGTCLQKFLQTKGVNVVSSSKEFADITNYQQLEMLCKQIQPTHIFNCAAYTLVDEAETKLELAMKINAEAPGILGKLARQNGCKLIHISTDYVFSGSGERPFVEEDKTNPINAYGRSKLEGENTLIKEFPSACIIRTSWVYGANGKNFISSIVKLLQSKSSLQVADDQIGKPTYCQDLVEALWDLKDFSGIYHFSSSGEASRYEIAKTILAFMKENHMPVMCTELTAVSAKIFATPAPRPAYSVLDTSKYERALHKKPRDWKDTLQELFS